VGDDAPSDALRAGFETVDGLLDIVEEVGLAEPGDVAGEVAACELILEALVARRKITRSDAGVYGRARGGRAIDD
jgi:magnesium chelatase subunit I